jgi:undecaprenyl pyrophosphate phosphatase UppP
MIIIGTITSIISSVFITRIFFDIIPSKKYKLFNL